MNAELIAIGTELLLGQIIDTNSAFLSRELAQLGIDVYHRQTVGDNPDRLADALRHALSRADLVITTGGLGPTSDDITREAVAQATQNPLERDDDYLQELEHWFSTRGLEMTENNRSQAYKPQSAEFIHNRLGTAPGLWVSTPGRIVICLPGPPGELSPMFDSQVVPRLQKLLGPGAKPLTHRTLKIVELGESRTEDRIKDLIAAQTNPTIALYAREGEIHLRVTAKARDKQEAAELIAPVEEALEQRLGDHIYGVDNDQLEGVVGALLRQHGYTLALAESCTGGLIGHRLTQIPGSSDYFLLGIVAYSNEAKLNQLGVREATLCQAGAVSPETAAEMALGAARAGRADCALATTGIAGPGGGSVQKPVGTVWFGVHTPGGTKTQHAEFQGDRSFIKRRTGQQALILLRRELLALAGSSRHPR